MHLNFITVDHSSILCHTLPFSSVDYSKRRVLTDSVDQIFRLFGFINAVDAVLNAIYQKLNWTSDRALKLFDIVVFALGTLRVPGTIVAGKALSNAAVRRGTIPKLKILVKVSSFQVATCVRGRFEFQKKRNSL